MATDLERFVDEDGRAEAVARSGAAHRGRGHHLRLLPVRLRHRPRDGQGHPGRPLGIGGHEGLPARLRRDGQPLHRSARRVHRLRARGGRTGRACPTSRPSARCPGTPRWPGSSAPSFVGREEVDDPGGFLTSDCRGNLRRLHAQFTAETGLHAARRLRARNDVAEDEPRRDAVGRRRDEALLLPHRPILRAATGDPPGDRVLHRHGARHDSG